MVDDRTVSIKLEQIQQFYGELCEQREDLSEEEFLDSTVRQRAVERMFENVIQASTDLAQHVATQEFGYDDDSTKGAVQRLAREGVIDEETAATLVAAVGFRNVLAHEYGHVDPVEVYELLQTELSVYEAYSRQVTVWIRE